MSSAHHEPVFLHVFDRESARRQFRLSLMLVTAMALAALALNLLLPSNSSRSLASNSVAKHHASFSRLATLKIDNFEKTRVKRERRAGGYPASVE